MSGAKLQRCSWPGTDPLYIAYHDEEWGVPERDDRALFEKLVLDGFQAGLSWITILASAKPSVAAFDSFAPDKMARFGARRSEPDARTKASCATAEDRSRDRVGAGVARNDGARRRLRQFLWGFVDGKPKQNAYKQDGRRSRRRQSCRAHISKALK